MIQTLILFVSLLLEMLLMYVEIMRLFDIIYQKSKPHIQTRNLFRKSKKEGSQGRFRLCRRVLKKRSLTVQKK